MPTRRSFLGFLGVGALASILPKTTAPVLPKPAAPFARLSKPEYPRFLKTRWPFPADAHVLELEQYRGYGVKRGDLILNINTREQFLVHTVIGDVLGVYRGIDSFECAIETTDKLLIIARAFDAAAA
jgi:hypothetical protein